MRSFIEKFFLSKFFEIELSPAERKIVDEAIDLKYIPALSRGILLSLLLIPATLLLDTQTVISVLIPITMVSGTAWYSVSLASMKKKFENFGLELTLNLFRAFILSLMMLFILTASSLTSFLWSPYVEAMPYMDIAQSVSAFLAVVVVFYLIWSVFSGSLQFDMNDSMLSGQNEAAERFFKRSLSLLHKVSGELREHKSLQVANYLIGVSFFEVYHVISPSEKVDRSIDLANKLIKNPSMSLEKANGIAFGLIEELVSEYMQDNDEIKKHKSHIAICDELECLKHNEGEDQEMTDMRLSVIFEEMAKLMEEFGDNLFR